MINFQVCWHRKRVHRVDRLWASESFQWFCELKPFEWWPLEVLLESFVGRFPPLSAK